MTTTRKLTELFRAIGSEDLSGASAIAAELCLLEERKGHRSAARQLRGALSGGQPPRQNGISAPPASNGNLMSTALVRLNDGPQLDDVTLPSRVRAELDEMIEEWQGREKLRTVGIAPRSKLLFHGPPGCGKSITAQGLGRALGLPVYMVRFDAVIGAFLGQTAMHLRQLFHFAETTPCILLLDELDALGKRRGNPLDVGELDRIVISLLQELEHSKPAGVVIGTTNLPKHLDDALWRRFDLDVFFPPPSQSVLRKFVTELAEKKKLRLKPETIKRAAGATSFAAAEKELLSALRKQALHSTGTRNGSRT